jgi:Retrotransposon gag protein
MYARVIASPMNRDRYTILWTGHHIYSKPEGGEQFAVYPLQHSQVHKDVWYEVAWDNKNAEFFAFADATVRFPEITLAKRKESPEEGDDTTKFTGDLTTALREAVAQVLPDPQPMTEDPQPRKKETTYAFKQGWLGVGTGAMFPRISRINPKAPAEPLPPKRPATPPLPATPPGGGGGAPGGGGGPPGWGWPGAGWPGGGGPGWPFGGFPGPGYNMGAGHGDGSLHMAGEPPAAFTGDHSKAIHWMAELENYHFLNRASQAVANPANRVAHAITLIRGPAVNGWARQCMKWLQQVTQGQQQVDDLWEAFRARFLLDFTDIAAAQKAQNELQTLTMDSKKGVDSYIVKFEELAEEAGFDLENPSILYYFWRGLPANLLS